MKIGGKLWLALVLGLVGVLLLGTDSGRRFERVFGTNSLFRLRGPVPAPAEVVIVAMDAESLRRLELPQNPEKWPRTVHARLLDRLRETGAKLVAFDVFFHEPRAAGEDEALAQAIRRAGNVILCQCLWQENRRLGSGPESPTLIVESGLQPLPRLAAGALAVAAFPLPKDPGGTSYYWAFKASAGGSPTLPTVVFTAVALAEIPTLDRLWPQPTPAEDSGTADLNARITLLRRWFLDQPEAAADFMDRTRSSAPIEQQSSADRLLRSFGRLYSGPDTVLLNFYGLPGTITTVPLYRVLGAADHADRQPASGAVDLRGKIVLVGLSGQSQVTIRDGFVSPFQDGGREELNGVEVAATAIANLLEDRPLQALSRPASFILVLAWGLIMGVACRLLSFNISVLTLVLAGVVYLLSAYHTFAVHALALPVAVPLLVQLPTAGLAALIAKLIDTIRERKKIRKVFECYVPQGVVDQLVDETTDSKGIDRLLYGCCLITDAVGYTRLAESLSPQELSLLMNEYLKTLFAPVRRCQGIISDVVGDSMMAVWTDSLPRAVTRELACRAALEIQETLATSRFPPNGTSLPTRIGLHAGEIFLGSIGAEDRYAFRALGDIVNTASRIESLNKQLGTRILATEEIVMDLDSLVCRDVGQFILVGKSRSVRVFELVAVKEACSARQQELCQAFGEALNACRACRWEEALECLERSAAIVPEDGPTRFYRELCESYRVQARTKLWDGQISLAAK